MYAIKEWSLIQTHP